MLGRRNSSAECLGNAFLGWAEMSKLDEVKS